MKLRDRPQPAPTASHARSVTAADVAVSELTLPEVARLRAQLQPDLPAFRFIDDSDAEMVLTFAELDRRATALAARLLERVQPLDRVMLAFRPGLEFVVAILGCMMAGVVAVPAALSRKNQQYFRLGRIAAHCESRLLLTDDVSAVDMAARLARSPWHVDLMSVALGSADCGSGATSLQRLAPPDPQTVALLQYTSGTTAQPRGVMVTHANLIAALRMIREGFELDGETVNVGWLPLHHDMGLIGNVCQTIQLGIRTVLMAPVSFAVQPVKWLRAISRYRATTSGGPNFAFDMCVQRITDDQMKGLDLSSWRVAFNGGESTRPETMERFSRKFAAAGFSAAAFYPCYGLAEATLFVSGGKSGDGVGCVQRADDARAHPRRRMVRCGWARGGHEIAIVDPLTRRRCPSGTVGEIWLRGPGIGPGYWKDDTATQATFGACLAGGEGPYLRTGDLGFIEGDDLVVAGRTSEQMLVDGRHLYAEDVEDRVTASHDVLKAGGAAAAFVVDVGNRKRLVVVHEVLDRRLSPAQHCQIGARACEEIERAFQVPLHDLVLVARGAIPRTTSGKKQRHLCRRAYQHGNLPMLDGVA